LPLKWASSYLKRSREQQLKKLVVFKDLHKEEVERISSEKDDYQEHDNSQQMCTSLVTKRCTSEREDRR